MKLVVRATDLLVVVVAVGTHHVVAFGGHVVWYHGIHAAGVEVGVVVVGHVAHGHWTHVVAEVGVVGAGAEAGGGHGVKVCVVLALGSAAIALRGRHSVVVVERALVHVGVDVVPGLRALVRVLLQLRWWWSPHWHLLGALV